MECVGVTVSTNFVVVTPFSDWIITFSFIQYAYILEMYNEVCHPGCDCDISYFVSTPQLSHILVIV